MEGVNSAVIDLGVAKVSSVAGSRKIQVTDNFLLQSLRHVGYDPIAALMELIDNSIDAGASNVWLNLSNNGNTLAVIDDGSGMSMTKLVSAMDLGYKRSYTDTEIGYFGAGLKSGMLNLIDLKKEGSKVEVVSFDGKETTKVEWDPLKNGFGYTYISLDSPSGYLNRTLRSGTCILIQGVIKLSEQVLKKELSKMYYPSLSVNAFKLFISGEDGNVNQIFPADPLYRHSPKTLHNILEAKVDGHTIEVHGVLIDEFQEKNHGERKTHKATRWPMEESGCYVIYGGRYIESGGLLGFRRQDPWGNRTRIEFTIPKELTSKFGLKFNKTKGLQLDRNEATSELERRINDVLTWSGNVRRKNNETLVTTDEKQQLKVVEDALNGSAKKARLKKPDTEVKEQPAERAFRLHTDKAPEAEIATKGEPTIRKEELFKLSVEPMNSAEVFWHFWWQNKRFFIVLNENHVFYQNIYRQMGLAEQKQLAMLLGAMAHAQYETMNHEDLAEENMEKFWQRFWSDVSTKLNHMYLT